MLLGFVLLVATLFQLGTGDETVSELMDNLNSFVQSDMEGGKGGGENVVLDDSTVSLVVEVHEEDGQLDLPPQQVFDGSQEEEVSTTEQRAFRATTGTSTTDMSPRTVALLALAVFFGGLCVVLAVAAVMQYRLIHAPNHGYSGLDNSKSPRLSPAQRLALVLLLLATIISTITVGVYFGVRAAPSSPLAPSSSAPATARLGGVVTSHAQAYDMYQIIKKFQVGEPTGIGVTSSCTKGTYPSATRKQIENLVNVYRGFNNLKPMCEVSAWSSTAQSAALIMAANKALSHDPPTTWKCWTQDGKDGAGSSNLATSTGLPSIRLYFEDPGAGNYFVGHRRWLLNPGGSGFGVGSVNGGGTGSSFKLWGSGGPAAHTYDTANQIVAWPSAGHFPLELVPNTKRWSFARGSSTDFTNAVIKMSWSGGSIAVTKQPILNGFAVNTLVWEVATEPWRTRDVTDVTVTISISGKAGFPYAYHVIIVKTEGMPRPSGTETRVPACGGVYLTTTGTATTAPSGTFSDYGNGYERISWTRNADANTEMSGLARRNPSNSIYITNAKLPAFARGQIFASASSTVRSGGQGWDEVRVVGQRAYIQQASSATTPTWVSLSGLSYVNTLTGFTNLALKAPATVYSTSWNQPSFRVSGNRVQTRGLTKGFTAITGSAALTVATNLPAHSIRDIFVCKSSNGPSRCDVTGTSIVAWPMLGGTWAKVGWLSLDGLQSFPSTTGFTNLVLRGTAKRYSTSYANPGAAIIGGTVYLRGLINMSTSTDKVVAILPSTMRPTKRHIFLQMCSRTSGQLCRVDVLPTGAVQLINTGTHNWLSLAGIHFVRTPLSFGP